MEAHSERLQEKLIGLLEDAHAMERGVRAELQTMIATTGGELRYPGVAELRPESIIGQLEEHKHATERHEQRVRDRLQALGAKPGRGRALSTLVGELAHGAAERAAGNKPVANMRRAFVNEHAEIALYEVIERLARRGGDHETADLAREVRSEEETMASAVAASWDKALDLTLAAEGLGPEPAGKGRRNHARPENRPEAAGGAHLSEND